MPARMMEISAMMLGVEAKGAHIDRTIKAAEMMDKKLSETLYLAGDELTAADVMTAFPFATMRIFIPFDLAPYPDLRAWLKRIGDRPAFQRAMKKADPDLVIPLD